MNPGHGHVYPRADGVKMRCGGPGICAQCSADQARKNQVQQLGKPRLPPLPITDEEKMLLRVLCSRAIGDHNRWASIEDDKRTLKSIEDARYHREQARLYEVIREKLAP